MHIVLLDKGKLVEKRGRKSTGLRELILRQRGYRIENGRQDPNKNSAPDMANCLRVDARRQDQ